MTEVSIAEARDTLTRLIQRAEAGEPVHITRRGKPVAVLVSEEDFKKFGKPRRDPMEFLRAWWAYLDTLGPDAVPLGNEFDDVRDHRPDPPHRLRPFD